MQNQFFYYDATERFVRDFQQDHDIELIGEEVPTPDFQEIQHSWNGQSYGTSVVEFTRLTFNVIGFILHHPHGAKISGEFSSPIEGFEQILNPHDEEMDCTVKVQELCAAIIAKCGRISGLREVNLI
jgi:hypothetical protein